MFIIEWVAALLIAPWFIGTLFVAAILFDHYDRRGFSIFWGTLILLGAFLLVRPTWVEIGIFVPSYIVLGLIWSFWRFRRYTRKKVAEYNKKVAEFKHSTNHRMKSPSRVILEKSIHPMQNKGRITYWLLVWPVSLVESVVGDLYDYVQSLITVVFRRTYEKIFESAMKDAVDDK